MSKKIHFETTPSAGNPTGIIAVSPTNPLPVTSSGGGGTQDVNLIEVGGVAITEVPVSIAGLTAMTNSQLDISTTQVAVPTSNLAGRKTIAILALAANAQKVYVGLTGVNSTNGFELSAGNAVEIDVDDTVNLFCIAASGTQKISVVEAA